MPPLSLSTRLGKIYLSTRKMELKNSDGWSARERNMTNICIHCVHHTSLAGSNDHFCRHPDYQSEPDLVTGSRYFVKCADMRTGDCGKEGKFFQKRAAPPMTKLIQREPDWF